MLRRLDGKIALVSGVSQGIGGSIAKAFAAEGAKVVCSGILMDDIVAVVDEIRSSGGAAEKARLDVTSVEEWREVTAAIVRDFGAINVLVNNAGLLQLASIADTSLDDFKRVHRVNVDGVFLGIKTALEVMQPGGSIINISSVCASIGCKDHSAYGSSKAAVSGLTRHAASECAANNSGVRVNAICPGAVRSPMFIETDENIAKVTAAQPLGIGSPNDIASAALYLASDESRWVTGTEITIDGGMSVRT